jgi:hypothetical protein
MEILCLRLSSGRGSGMFYQPGWFLNKSCKMHGIVNNKAISNRQAEKPVATPVFPMKLAPYRGIVPFTD